MLKFTKYGRRLSQHTGGYSPSEQTDSSSFQSAPGVPILSSFEGLNDDRNFTTAAVRDALAKKRGSRCITRDIQMSSSGSSSVSSSNDRSAIPSTGKGTPEGPASFSRKSIICKRELQVEQIEVNHPPRHLSFSKVPQEELLKLDSEISRSSRPSTKRVRLNNSNPNNPYGTLGKMSTRTSLVSIRTWDWDVTEKVTVPVYNDGFFPKVQPLNKLIAMKQTM